MLDVRLVDIAFRIGGLDIIIEQLVAESRQVAVGDFCKVVIRHLVGGQEIINLTVGSGGVERLAGFGQLAFVHGDGDPRAHFIAARVGFILIAGDWISAVVIDADFYLQVAVGDAGDVVGMRPDVELGIHAFEETRVDAGHIVEPTEGVAAGVVGEALGLEDGRRGAVLRAARRRHPRCEFFHRTTRGEAGFHFVVIA